MLATTYPRFLRLKEVTTITGLARSTIYKMIANNQFPPQTRLAARSVAWLDSEVVGWVQSRLSERPEAPSISAK